MAKMQQLTTYRRDNTIAIIERIKNDINGNPRYTIIAIKLCSNGYPFTRKKNIGGYYNEEDFIQVAIDMLKDVEL